MKKTAEFVSPKHPDKICDFIADSILDEYLKNDKESRVAVEIMGGHGLITINGEVTSKSHPDMENGKVQSVVASFQNTKNDELLKLVKEIIKADEYLINPAGEWTHGGFDADTGLSGRKLVIDNYGPEIPIGGGSFSGKDATKVDRSGAYMARYVAKNLVASGYGKEVLVSVAYAIGMAEPLMIEAINEKGEDLAKIYIITIFLSSS